LVARETREDAGTCSGAVRAGAGEVVTTEAGAGTGSTWATVLADGAVTDGYGIGPCDTASASSGGTGSAPVMVSGSCCSARRCCKSSSKATANAAAGHPATSTAVMSGRASAMFAANDAITPAPSAPQASGPPGRPVRRRVSSTMLAATTSPSMDSGISQDRQSSPALTASCCMWL